MKKKSQAALEFLTTYAWAFVVILIAISALYYFGIFEFSKLLPQRCIFSSQFECLDFSFVDDQVRFKLINNVGEPLNINNIDITNDAAAHLTCTLLDPDISAENPFAWKPGNEMIVTFSECKDGVFIKGERTDAQITITYCAPATPGCPEHTINGKITAVVT